MARIKITQPAEASGKLSDVYSDILEKRGCIAEVHKVMGLNPEATKSHLDFYMAVMFEQSPLSRELREMLAVVVSRANNCVYCQKHHAKALNEYWQNDEKTEAFRVNYKATDLPRIDRLFCDLAKQLTSTPSNIKVEKVIDQLKEEGVDDRSLLDACLVISYFNFINRIVLGLGVETESSAEGSHL